MTKRGWSGLPQFSKDMYTERYLKNGESYEQWAHRIASTYSDNEEHASRIETYISNYWFHPSTPIASSADLPISCYTNTVEDSKSGIFSAWSENNWLGSLGGGIGTDWSSVREIGHTIGTQGKSSGIIPFIKVSDSTTLAVSQGGLRRASQAVYLDIHHPEINEFVDIRRPTGDKDRRSTNIHHGVTITDKFMHAMLFDRDFDLVSPKDGEVVATIKAWDLWQKILVSRVETGEPYLLFIDTVNRMRPQEYIDNNLSVITSNLCSEITLTTDADHSGVCCLTSMNLEYWDEFENSTQFFEDIHAFTDNVLQRFIDDTEFLEGFERVRRSAIRERSIGIGVMGFHQYLQSKKLPFGSYASMLTNKKIFSKIDKEFTHTNWKLAIIKGPNRLSKIKRNTHVTAIAPTASISTLCNLSSPGIDPRVANTYTAKTNIGSYTVRNKYLEELLEKYAMNDDDVWKSIMKNQGSVQHLEFMNDIDKEVFLTAYEIDNKWVVQYACDRAKFIDQAVSTNLFLPADINVKTLHDLHVTAWRGGAKSLYYLRSTSLNRATIEDTERECLACQ